MAFSAAPGAKPKEHMPGWKRWTMLAFAVFFDMAKAFCVLMVVVAPLALGLATKFVVESKLDGVFGHSAATWIADATGAVVTTGAYAGEIAVAPVTSFVEGLGLVCAIIVGLVGCLFFISILLFSGGFRLAQSGSNHLITIGLMVLA